MLRLSIFLSGWVGLIIDADNYIAGFIFENSDSVNRREFDKLIKDLSEKLDPRLKATLLKKNGSLNGTLCRKEILPIDRSPQAKYNEAFVDACEIYFDLGLQVPKDSGDIRRFSPKQRGLLNNTLVMWSVRTKILTIDEALEIDQERLIQSPSIENKEMFEELYLRRIQAGELTIETLLYGTPPSLALPVTTPSHGSPLLSSSNSSSDNQAPSQIATLPQQTSGIAGRITLGCITPSISTASPAQQVDKAPQNEESVPYASATL